MCGRYTLFVSSAELASLYDLTEPAPEWIPAYTLAPTNRVPIIRERLDEEGVVHTFMEKAVWGLRPHWWTPTSRMNPPINARLETAHEKPTFKKPFQSGRCLIPMTVTGECKPRP